MSLPERRYDLAGQVMAQALVDAGQHDVPIAAALPRAARRARRSVVIARGIP